MPNEEENYRLDKWLWAARFFKSRTLATEAVNGGKVQLNDRRTTPGKDLKVGDHLTIHKEGLEFQVVVTALSIRRGPATVATTLYEESPASLEARAKEAETRRNQPVWQREEGNRPTKRDRRVMTRLRGY